MKYSNKNMQKILFALQVVGQPRNAKRIAMLKEVGFEVEAIAFDRDYHRGRTPDCPVQIVGRIERGQRFKRVLAVLSAIPKTRQAMKASDIIYASGPDMALLCLLSGFGLRHPIVLENGDIEGMQTAPGLAGWFVRAVDKWIANRCSLLVATAPGFVDDYYRQWLNTRTPALVIENKLEPPDGGSQKRRVEIKNNDNTPLVDRPLRIGYFGLLRCAASWKILEHLASLQPQGINIIVAGHPIFPEDLVERAKEFSNIEFKGEYRSPQDLPALYGGVDIVWACYPFPKADDQNWKWARTNRFYESCYFNKPMIVLENSGDAYEVEHHGIGKVVQNKETEEVARDITNIKPEDLENWRANMVALPRQIYTYTTEAQDLKQALMDIVASRHGA